MIKRNKIQQIEILTIQEKAWTLLVITLFMSLLILFGMGLNWKIVENNGYKMPVLSSCYFETENHFGFIENSEIKYHYLADRFTFIYGIWSIGDFILFTGLIGNIIVNVLIWVLAFRLVKFYDKNKSRTKLEGGMKKI